MGQKVADLEASLGLNDKDFNKGIDKSEKEAKKMLNEIEKANERTAKEIQKNAEKAEKTRIKSARESAQVFIQEEKKKESEALKVENEKQRLVKETARIQKKEALKVQQEQKKLNDKNIAEQQAMYDKLKSIAKSYLLVATAVGASAFVGLAKNSIKYTSDLRELENVLSVTFGERFNAIALNADAMGVAMGRSSLQMRGMVAQAGALGKGLGFVGDDLESMSIELAKTAIDMGSFFNVADDEAFTALRAGLTGETEPMKRFGIVMTENNLKAYALQAGVKKLWKELTEAEKTQIRYNYILQKTSFFAGDAQRTIGSTANQTKVMQANLGRLYQTVGKEIEPVWNEFLKNLNKTIESFAENEEKGHGFATTIIEISKAIQTLGKPIEWIITLMQKLGEVNKGSVEKMSFDDQYNDIISNQKEFLKKNKDFFDEKEKQYKKAHEKEQESTIAYNRTLLDDYKTTEQYKLDVVKKYNEQQQEQADINKAKTKEIYGNMVEESKGLFAELINASGKMKQEIGQDLIDALEFYVKFTKGMSAELKKQVAVTAALGSAKSAVEQGKSRSEAGVIASQTYKLTMGTLGLDTGNQDSLIKGIRGKYNYKPFKVSDFDNTWVKTINDSPVEEKDKKKKDVLTLDELKSQYEAEKTAFEEYAKQRQLSTEEKNQQLLSIEDSYSKQAIENGWTEYASTLSANANKLQNIIETNENDKKIAKENRDLAKENQKKELDDLKSFLDEQNKIKEEDNQKKSEGDVVRTLGSSKDLESLANNYNDLILKYQDNEEILKVIDTLYAQYLENLGKETKTKKDLSKSISDAASLTSELATLFDDDLLGAMSNVLNGISSGIASYASGNMLGTITSAVGVLGTVSSALDWTNDVNAEAQNEANEKFAEAVENFKKAVDDMTLGQAISFSKLEKPANLSSGNVTGGSITDLSSLLFGPIGGNLLGTDISWGASNASVDTSKLQELLNSSGYEDINTQAVMDKYAIREDYYDLSDWGKKKSRIVGYDTAGAMAEIQKLIDAAYEQNMENIKEALGFTHTEFANNMASVFKVGGDIATSLNDMFSNALITAFFNQEAFEILNKQIGNAMSEAVLGEMANLGLDMNLTGTFEEQMAQYAEITGASFDILNEIMKKYGITVGKTTETMQSLENTLPSGFKLALAGYNAINTTVNQGQTIVYQVENNYSKDFQEMVDTATNQSRYLGTGNLRGRGY